MKLMSAGAIVMLALGLTASCATMAPPPPVETEITRYQWGQYRVVSQQYRDVVEFRPPGTKLSQKEKVTRQRIQIQDEHGRVLQEIRGGRIDKVDFVEMTGGGVPELYVGTYSGGAHCCYVQYYFTQNGGLRNLLIFLGSNSGIGEIKDLDADGRPELIAGNDVLVYFDDLSFAGSPGVEMVIGWDGQQYRDRTQDYPERARRKAQEHQAAVVKALASQDESERVWGQRTAALGYYANSLVIGEGTAARAWWLEHADKETRIWLCSHEEELLKQLAKSCKVRVSQQSVLDLEGSECACEAPASNDCPVLYGGHVMRNLARLQTSGGKYEKAESTYRRVLRAC